MNDVRTQAARGLLASLRTRLLDLTATNPLISFNHTRNTGSRTHLRAVDIDINALVQAVMEGQDVTLYALPPLDDIQADAFEDLDDTFLAIEGATQEETGGDGATDDAAGKVATGGRQSPAQNKKRKPAITRAAIEAHAIRSGINVSYEMCRGPNTDASGVSFQTLLWPESFQKTASKIYDTVRGHQEETGINTLHLALGSLEWYETEYSDKAFTTPLVVLQVVLERKVVHGVYKYSLSSADVSPQVNRTLSEKLYNQFRFRLPDLTDETDIWEYFDRVAEIICASRPRWCVRPYVTLAQFPFARLVMFNDLSEEAWSSELAERPLIKEILGGNEGDGPVAQRFAAEHDVDGSEVRGVVPFIALEADASQHSAIYDAMSGKNLVIQGPPGTGKSQTITNIIATAMAAGKRILFIADKQAALQVVKARLDEVGLGDFCLDLHSGRSRKSIVMEDMAKRINLHMTWRDQRALDASQVELDRRRSALNDYASIMNRPFGQTQMTVHDIIWSDRRRRTAAGNVSFGLEKVIIHNAEAMTAVTVENARARLRRFEQQAIPMKAAWPDIAAHPWFGMMNTRIASLEFGAIIRAAEMAAEGAERTVEASDALLSIGFNKETSYTRLMSRAKSLIDLNVPLDLPFPYYSALRSRHLRQETTEWLYKCEACAANLQKVVAWGFEEATGDCAEDATKYEKMADRITAAISLVGRSFPPGLTVGGMREWADMLMKDGERLHELVDTALLISKSAGDADPVSREDIRALLTFSGCLRTLDLSWIDRLGPGLTGRNAQQTFDAVRRDCQAVRAQADDLAATYHMASIPEAGILREAAATLRAAGLMAFMNSAVRQATRIYQGLRKTPSSTSRAEMAAGLDVLAEHKERVAGLALNSDYKTLIGPDYRGFETDFALVEPPFAWVVSVRRQMLEFGERGTRLRDALLTVGPDALERLYVSLRSIPLERSLEHLSQLDSVSSPPQEAAAIRAKASQVNAAADRLRDCGVDPGIGLSDISTIVSDLRCASQWLKKVTPPDLLVSAVGERIIHPLRDNSAIKQAMDVAEDIANSSLPEEVTDYVFQSSPEQLANHVKPLAEAFLDALQKMHEDSGYARKLLDINDRDFFGEPIDKLPPQAIAKRFRKASDAAHDMGEWVAFNRERQALVAEGLGDLLVYWENTSSTLSMVEMFELAYHHSLVKAVFAAYPVLEEFSGLSQEECRQRFADLDRQATVLARKKLAYTLSRREPPAGNRAGRRSEWTDYALLQNETNKQKRHIPLRKLFDQAGDAIQALKPCFMMSPISVAQYLKAEGLTFDLLVIDEASQMLPEDAMGAIARSAQIVVVGDHMQLPPTNFFGAAKDDIGDDDEDEEAVDAESILDLASSTYQPTRRLRVHYRSRHESLIAFSNRRFYDDALIVFPSPGDASATAGVSLINVDGIYSGNVNRKEADAVCAAAVSHMHDFPDRSLGIGTINSKQRDLIMEQMELLQSQDPVVAEFCARENWGGRIEPFFVKNLETIQGDERDTIFVSTLFGPPSEGKKPFQRFGAINRASGHRRLNVLFTRARHQLVVYTSLKPTDINADTNLLKGTQVFRDYLTFAATGRLDTGFETGREPDSDFEIFVSERLRQAGYAVVPQVGVAGFFIDLAIRHPEIPGTFLLGIECDGATYHSGRSARDRDILRQQILEGLGWNIYRIWSTDWFRDPEGQSRKMLSAIKDLEITARHGQKFRSAPSSSQPHPSAADSPGDVDGVEGGETECSEA